MSEPLAQPAWAASSPVPQLLLLLVTSSFLPQQKQHIFLSIGSIQVAGLGLVGPTPVHKHTNRPDDVWVSCLPGATPGSLNDGGAEISDVQVPLPVQPSICTFGPLFKILAESCEGYG